MSSKAPESKKTRSNSSFSSATASATAQGRGKSATTNANYLLDKEEEYKRLNDELEKKTATLVYEAEQVLKANEKLLNEADYLDKISDVNFLQPESHQETKKDAYQTLLTLSRLNKNEQEIEHAVEKELAEEGEEEEVFKFQSYQQKHHQQQDSVTLPSQANEMSSEAQIRFLKAKLKVLQEEIDRLAGELNKRDEENLKLAQRCKELDEDRAKQLRISNAHQTQVDKHKKLNEELQVNVQLLAYLLNLIG